jgi:hypothetical protein
MTDGSFSLRPFPAADQELGLTITGAVARRPGSLAVRYALRGRLDRLLIPPPAPRPARRPRLWEATCFEFFLAASGSPRYWEFNLSPAGHWNAYRFAAYRRGMEEEPAFTSLPFRVQSRPEALLLALELDLGKILRPRQAIEVAVAAVVQAADGDLTYWALTHGGPQPDFHRRESFRITL